jgi:glycosyltransferase involved in cell wall biosynthesis
MIFGAKIVRRLEESSSDIVHSHTRFAIALSFFGLKKPHVVHLHGLPYYATENNLGRRRYDYGAYLHLYAFLRDCDMVICYCRSLRKRVIDLFGLPPHQVRVIPNGIDGELLDRGNFSLREKFGLQDKKIALFVGRAEHIKGAEEFIYACREAKREVEDLVPVIIGSGWDSLLQRNNNGAIWIPHLPHNEIGSAYRESDVHVAVTKIYGNQKTVQEAAACGTPIVATRNIDNFQVCGDDAVYVNPVSVKEISEGIIRQVKYPPPKRNLRKVSIKVRENLSWKNSADRLQRIYSEITEG